MHVLISSLDSGRQRELNIKQMIKNDKKNIRNVDLYIQIQSVLHNLISQLYPSKTKLILVRLFEDYAAQKSSIRENTF